MRGPQGWVTKLTSRDPAAYLGVLVVGAVSVPVADLLLPAASVVGDLDVSEFVGLVVAAIALALWLRCRPTGRLGRLERMFLAALAVIWVLTMGLSILRSPVPSPSALFVGLMVLMVWLKPPGPQSASRCLDVLGWTLVAAVIVTVSAESLGLVESWYAQLNSWDLQAYELEHYWLPLADVLGIDGRWAGPFTHPNRAGPIGAFLLALALGRRGWQAWTFVAVGLVVLLLTASRTSQLAALAAVVTMLAAPRILRGVTPARSPRGLVPTVLAGLAIVIVAPVLLSSVAGPGVSAEEYVSSAANLTGRTTAWPIYLELWRGSPWTGTGAEGIYAAIYEGVMPAWATHAHNLVLDALTRYGLLVGALAVAVLVIAAVATTPAARSGRPLGLAIVALTVVAGLGHTTIGWVYPEVPLLALVLAVLASTASPASSAGPVRQTGPG